MKSRSYNVFAAWSMTSLSANGSAATRISARPNGGASRGWEARSGLRGGKGEGRAELSSNSEIEAMIEVMVWKV